MYETDIQPGTVVQLCTHRDTSRTHRYDARVLPSDRAAKNDAHQRERIRTARDHAEPSRTSRAVASDVHGSTRQTNGASTHMSPQMQRTSKRGPPQIRPIEHQQRSDSSVPCSFWSFSNGGKVNSACEQVMAQTTLSMTVLMIWAGV